MACKSVTLNGINLSCADHTGGIKEVYIIKEEDIESIKIDELSSEVETITLKLESKFSTYRFRKGTSFMTSTATADESIGTFSVQTDLSLQFSKMDTQKRLELMGLCLDNTKAIVRDNNDMYWLLGKDFPLGASAATGETGTAFSDFGGYKVTLSDNSKEFPYPLSTAAVSALKEQINEPPLV